LAATAVVLSSVPTTAPTTAHTAATEPRPTPPALETSPIRPPYDLQSPHPSGGSRVAPLADSLRVAIASPHTGVHRHGSAHTLHRRRRGHCTLRGGGRNPSPSAPVRPPRAARRCLARHAAALAGALRA